MAALRSMLNINIDKDGGREELSASFLIETMVVLPLFICAMVFLMFHFRVLQVQVVVEEALSYTGRTLAAQAIDDEEGSDTDLMDLSGATLLFREKLSELECPEKFIRFGANGISLMDSRLEENDIELTAAYEMKVPVSVFGILYYHIVQTTVSRKWIGDRSFIPEGEAGEWVYITPSGDAYHSSPTCNYLDLSIRSSTRAEVGTLRNVNSHKYKPCERCVSSRAGLGAVYITDYGETYHSSLSCSSLKRTVYMVRITEVGHRHACSKCY